MIITGAPCLSPSFQDFTRRLSGGDSTFFGIFSSAASQGLSLARSICTNFSDFFSDFCQLHYTSSSLLPYLSSVDIFQIVILHFVFYLFEVLITWALCNKLFDHPGGLNYQMGDGSWIMFLQGEDWARFVKRVIEESILWLRALPPSSTRPPPCSSSKSLWFSNVTSPFRPVGHMIHNL